MIVYPQNWDYIYKRPTLDEIEQVMCNAVVETNCANLCLSGGVDSSLALQFMSRVYSFITCYTIASSLDHPDAYYSKLIASQYKVTHMVYIPIDKEIESSKLDGDLQGDVGVRLLFKYISKYTDKVITTDCIDELDCGYYPHQKEPSDETFRRFILDLEEKHLKPLDRNSGGVKVFLPYATEGVINTFLRIPISEKVNKDIRKSHVMAIASKYLPPEIIERRKYGFNNALENIKI